MLLLWEEAWQASLRHRDWHVAMVCLSLCLIRDNVQVAVLPAVTLRGYHSTMAHRCDKMSAGRHCI